MKSIEESIASCLQELETSRSDNGHLVVTAAFRFPITFCGFDGHFPNNPILPAIVQLAMVRCVAEQGIGKPLFPATIGKTKFKAMILPDQDILVSLNLHEDGDRCHCRFQIHKPNREMIAGGSCLFIENYLMSTTDETQEIF